MRSDRFNLALSTMLASMVAAGFLGACQMTESDASDPGSLREAVLENDAPENLAALRAALGAAVGRAQIDLGPGDPTKSSVVTVLPPPVHPNETHSMARPTQFRMVLKDDACLAVRQDTGEAVMLEGVRCRPTEN